MKDKDDLLYLRDIRDQSENILSESKIMSYEEFCSRKIYQNGMILSIIIIGDTERLSVLS